MELSHLQIWSEWFPKFAPHYSEEVDYLEYDVSRVSDLDKLNLVKTVLSGYVIVLALFFQVSTPLLTPIVCVVGSPIFLASYCKYQSKKKATDN